MMDERYENFLKLNFYQIYPKSFMDANNDGIGDFNGITQKIPYLAELGINAVWLSPCYKSPGVDSGYDISDYTDVGEEFGTLDDFKKMLDCFHSYGIKVIIDLVVNHCSTEHRWFKEAKKSRDNPYHDYFYWFDEKPNDWSACFGGSAWQWEESVKQYYLHSFAVEQADLNWENPKVREEVKDIIDFWVDLGVDGFRCDVLDAISKDIAAGINSNGPRLHEFINEIFGREKTKHLYTIGECWGVTEDSIKDLTSAERGELTTAFVSGNIVGNNRRFYLPKKWDYDIIHRFFSKNQVMYEKNDLIFAPFFENHDQCRCISKFADDKQLRFESATFFATILYTMKGTPFILQGQEFGTPDAYYNSIDYFDDAETIGFYNRMKDEISEEELIQRINRDSRDNGRHPITWNGEINGGFNSGAKPWLPIHSRVNEINLERDKKSNKSIFKYFKKLIALRKSSNALIYGVFDDMTGDRKDCFIYTRTYGDEKILVICNYDKSSVIDVPANYEKLVGNYDGENNGVFRPFESVIYKVQNSQQTIEMNSVKIIFDKEKTKEYRTDFNKPCDCQDCRNYYKNIQNNFELVEFLSGFGIDYNCTEEVFSWDLGNDNDALIHHEGYYGVFGKIEGNEFDFEKFGVKITFQKVASVPCDRTGEYFWICIEGEFPYILDEERDLPITFSQKLQKLGIISKIKSIFKKK